MKYSKEDLYVGFTFLDKNRIYPQVVKYIHNHKTHEVECEVTKQGTTSYTLSYLLEHLNSGVHKVLTPKIDEYQIF